MSSVRTLSRRVARLEGKAEQGVILVWCDDPADMGATIEDMLARGEIDPRDLERCRCVCWLDADAPPGRHEDALAELDSAP